MMLVFYAALQETLKFLRQLMQVKAIRHGNVCINANVNSFVPQAGKS